MEKPCEIDGPIAMHNAREISKLPDGSFTIVFFPYSRSRGEASAHLRVKEHCRLRWMETTCCSSPTRTASRACAGGYSSGSWLFLGMDSNFIR